MITGIVRDEIEPSRDRARSKRLAIYFSGPMAAVVVALGLLQAGCAPSWTKPGATQADFERDKGACGNEAELEVPFGDRSATPFARSFEGEEHLADYGNLRDACLRRMGWTQ
jgi:hypothetical protein